MAEPKGLRVPVLVDREMYDMFKAYSEITGVPVSRVIREALKDFAETSLDARMETLTKKTVNAKFTPFEGLETAESIEQFN